MLSRRASTSVFALLFLTGDSFIGTATAWIAPPTPSVFPVRTGSRPSTQLNGFLDFLSPYESKIPEELKEEIYQAEANTPAAKDRSQRVALYALLAFFGLLGAFFNGFLTELRADGPDGSAGVDLAEAGFGWVTSNFLSNFLFMNKIGGGIMLLFGAGSGLLAETELDTKRINAEKIYEELERRRNAKNKPAKKKKKVAKKKQSGKKKKRLAALSEVVIKEEANEEQASSETTESEKVIDEGPKKQEKKEEEKKGLMGGIKDFYEQADSMAASQALLLNKQLEDAGMIDKITDESGLKVIGKEAAEKRAEAGNEEASK